MNKKIFSMIILACAITLSGCGFTESSELMTGARKFIENGEYDKAMSNLSKVLDEDESNTEARGMYYQALKLMKARKYDARKDYEQEIKELQDLINDNSGSAKVRDQAEDMLSKARESEQRQKRATITRKENAKKTAEENKNRYKDSQVYYSGTYGKYSNKSNNGVNNQSSQDSSTARSSKYGRYSNYNQNSASNQESVYQGGNSGAGQPGHLSPGNSTGRYSAQGGEANRQGGQNQ